MNNKTNQITKKSFWQIITEYNIEIPIIQRDYAQGREDQKTKTIREMFLKNLVNAITKISKPIELDFVYGDVEEKDNILQPLDGQQRLTTLFLLHWYIARKIKNKENETTIKSILGKFTYETRITSRDFCKDLVDNIYNLEQKTSIDEQIKDATWFYRSWENDPTIKAMLVMLKDIENKLISYNDDMNEIWKSLTDDNAASITFHFIPLKDFGLSDDLYIKMNARGKELTPFEKFKAQFEKYIEEQGWEKDYSPENTFAHKADTVWTDLFWKHRDKKNNIDSAFINCIAGIAIHVSSLNSKKNEEKEELIRELHKNLSNLDPEKYFHNKDEYDYLITCLDMYSDVEKEYDKLKPLLKMMWDDEDSEIEEKPLFEELIKSEINYRERALFYAQTEYLIKNKDKTEINEENFSHWMRVIRNIVNNVNEVRDFISAVNIIQKLAEECNNNNIYQYLSRSNLEIDSKSAIKEQIKEEKLKAKIIQISPENKQVIFDTEDTNCFRGQITFALYCTINDIKNINIAEIPEKFQAKEFKAEKLSKIKCVIKEYLNNHKYLKNDKENKFRRALLVMMKDHEFQDSKAFRHNSNGEKLRRALDYNTYCLIEDIKDFRYKITPRTKEETKEYFKYFRELLKALTTKNLDEIINDFNKTPEGKNDWRRIVIKDWTEKFSNIYLFPYYFGEKVNRKDYCLYLRGYKQPRSIDCIFQF